MADSGIKKVIIPKEKLGTILTTNQYVVRYRVVSEDKNRASFWSPNYLILSTPVFNNVSGDVDFGTTGNSIRVIWDNLIGAESFDIFVAFNSALDKDLKWHGTTTQNNYSFMKTGVFPVRVIVQVKSIGTLINGAFAKTYNSALVLYDSGQKSPQALV